MISWVAAILTELLPPCGIESLCILIGCQAAALAILTCIVVGLRFRRGIFLLLLIATSLPAAYFVVVARQIARTTGLIP